MKEPIVEQQFRITEIEVLHSTTDEKILGVFRYEPDTSRGKRGPTLLLLAEIHSSLYVYERLLDAVSSTIEQARHFTSGVDADPMARFEKLVHHVNETVHEFLKHEPTPITWNRVSLFLLQFSDGHMCISGLGRLTNIFLQKQEDGSYRAFDLFGSLEQPALVDPEKCFSALICGDIHAGDQLFIGSMNFDRLRNELRLQERMKHLPPVTASLEIQQELESQHIPDDFAGVIIACVSLPIETPIERVQTSKEKKTQSTRSVEKIRAEEKQTDKLLSPTLSPLPSFSDGLHQSWMQALRSRLSRAHENLKERWSEMRNKKTKTEKNPVVLASLRGMHAGTSHAQISKRRKAMIGGAATVLGIVLAIVWYQVASKQRAAQKLWNASFDQARDEQERAESMLLYGNEDQARPLVESAYQTLLKLNTSSSYRKRTKEQGLRNLQEIRQKLQHVITMDSPTTILTSSEEHPGPFHGLLSWKNALWTIDAGGRTLLRIDPKRSTTKAISLLRLNSEIITLIAGQERLFLVHKDRTLTSLNANGEDSIIVTLKKNEAASTQTAAIYNRRLYLLDPIRQMIWKYTFNRASFGQETPYLKQPVPRLAKAMSMAIDVNVLVGMENGTFARFLSGTEAPWSPAPLDPPLGSITGIATHVDLDRVIVTDATKKRLSIFRQDGRLVSQIVSKLFERPTQIAIDVSEKKIYVADEKAIFRFEIQ